MYPFRCDVPGSKLDDRTKGDHNASMKSIIKPLLCLLCQQHSHELKWVHESQSLWHSCPPWTVNTWNPTCVPYHGDLQLRGHRTDWSDYSNDLCAVAWDAISQFGGLTFKFVQFPFCYFPPLMLLVDVMLISVWNKQKRKPDDTDSGDSTQQFFSSDLAR